MKIFFNTIILLCFSSALGHAQKNTPQDYAPFQGKTVSKIIVLGNHKTKDIVILREMKTKVGGRFNVDRVEEDRKRIQNLLLFTRVEIHPAKDDDKVGLIIVVAERWHFLPYPVLFRNERSWELEKWSYGAGLVHNNIRGMRNRLLAEFWFGYNPGGLARYSNPWFGGDKQFYYTAKLYSMTMKSKTLETLERFDEFRRSGSFTFGKRWGYHTYTTAAVGYNYIQYPDDYQYLMPSDKSWQHVPSLGVGFMYDTRDLFEYPREGWLMSLGVTAVKNSDQLDYYLLATDVRRYVRLYKDISLALRLSVDLSHGDVPIFSRYYLGYSERIRGEFYNVMEGDGRAVFMTELRFPILPVQYIDLDYGTSTLGEYAQDLPFGISGGLFYDAGAAWFKDKTNTPADFLSGFGFGLHFHLPYVDVFRIEYALNSSLEGQIIIDTGVAF